ncbi:hypothetical protein WG66_004438 [Moniliophthora roreri]|nr:hypothetical protein WG66_004438 [Moniliophthora roreri]
MDLFSVLDPDGLSTDMDSLFTEEFACITPSSKISTLSKYVPVPDQLPVDQEFITMSFLRERNDH